MKQLTFEEPRWDDFPCLKLAFECGRQGGTLPAVLNAANEVAVELLLQDRIRFGELPQRIESTLAAHDPITEPTLDDLLEVDRWARERAAAGMLQSGSQR